MKSILNMVLVASLVALVGCTKKTENSNLDDVQMEPTGKQYLASSEPAGSVPVGKARADVKDGETVALVGHIGGSREPFVEGIAAFTIVDPQVPYCQAEEGCPTPWDYCCTQNLVKDGIATVKVVDGQDNPVAEDARQLLGVKELSLVVVEGTAKRDEQGNLSILAKKIFVKK